MKELHEILKEPHITESSSKNMVNPRTGVRKYVFKVGLSATKQEIKNAIESRFGYLGFSIDDLCW